MCGIAFADEFYGRQFGLDLLQVTSGEFDVRAAKIFLKAM
jgi:hypothetical protein